MDKRGPIIGAWLSIGQGALYIASGLWALVAKSSYQEIHELKSDFWILTTHGVWLLLVGGVLAIAGYRRQKSLEVRLLAFGAALGLLATDLASAATVGVAQIYYTDMMIELVFVVLWLVVWTLERRKRRDR
jgi:hypothetical protein